MVGLKLTHVSKRGPWWPMEDPCIGLAGKNSGISICLQFYRCDDSWWTFWVESNWVGSVSNESRSMGHFFHTGEDFVSRVIDSFVSLELEMVFLDDKVQEFFPLPLPDRCRLLFLPRRHRAVSVTIQRWRHHMETISPSLTLCEGNPSVTAGFPSKGTVMLTLNTSLNK